MSKCLPDADPTLEMKLGIAGHPIGIPPNGSRERGHQEPSLSSAKPGRDEDRHAVERENADLIPGSEVKHPDEEHGPNNLGKNPTTGLLNKDFRQTHSG